MPLRSGNQNFSSQSREQTLAEQERKSEANRAKRLEKNLEEQDSDSTESYSSVGSGAGMDDAADQAAAAAEETPDAEAGGEVP